MTARILQQAVVTDLALLFNCDSFKKPGGGMAHPQVFSQFLPKRYTSDKSIPFPLIIVRLSDGGIEDQAEAHKINLKLIIGVYDDDQENGGHFSVLEIIERIQQHYEEYPVLAEQFRFTDPFVWALQDEESYPFFYGACNLTFEAPPPRIAGSVNV